MSDNGALTLKDFERMATMPEYRSAIIEYRGAVTGEFEDYQTFVARINAEIDSIIDELESSRDQYHDKQEDHITQIICSLLKRRSIVASHGTHNSGSTDITVEHGPNKWLCEAKIWTADPKVIEGMRQLTTRYATGGDNADSGGVLLYNKTTNLTEKLTRLRTTYANQGKEFENIVVSDCADSSYAFFTDHKHDSTGANFRVRHRAVNLHHAPQDVSAKNRKSNATTNT